MSCYIDAFMELFWHSILPHIEIDQIASQTGNPLDNIMAGAFVLVKQGFRLDASTQMRNFVYKNIKELYFPKQPPYEQGNMYDVVDFAMDYMEQASEQFRAMFQYKCSRYNMCFEDTEHCWFMPDDTVRNTPLFITFIPSVVDKFHLSTSSDQSAHAITHLIGYPRLKQQCIYCQKLAYQYKLPHNDPAFVFVIDKLGAVPNRTDNIIFPYIIQLYSQRYQLHAMIHSTSRTGIHYKTTAVIHNNGGCFLACLDNLSKPGITVITENVNEFYFHFSSNHSSLQKKLKII
ncbi:hypothetical protein BDA99DRAFT_284549 [Phascolomyces articulosus]|uniref:Uncharacterized protein n=1 Tax=Phascolomyces articulosus TaxID=60185 RepID=A0AAD5PHG6_9FUNG|nr:hypothetical protein BDA99DRAFT_284549 [Phascolomyces articulosus]